jgi:hypothetical protein
VPLLVGGTIIGVLKVENISIKGREDNREFSHEARRRFDLLAQDVALAIARLDEERGLQYQVINDAMPTIFEILRGGLDVKTLVNKVVTATATLLNARVCSFPEGRQWADPTTMGGFRMGKARP